VVLNRHLSQKDDIELINNKHNSKISCLIPDLPSPEELLPYLKQIQQNKWYSNFGPLFTHFEKGVINLLEKYNASSKVFGCLTSSGTSALEVALTALNLNRDDKVLVPGLTYPASGTSIIRCGLRPLICDVDKRNWQLTPEIAYKLIDYYSIKAVLPVATYGVPVDTKAWDKFSKETKIPVIIDAAGSFPFQKIAEECLIIFSFHATKLFGIGEGGGIFLKNEVLNKRIKEITNFGFHKGVISSVGCNAKLSEYHAAVGLAQLDRWQTILNKKLKINTFYNEIIEQYPNSFVPQQNINSVIPSMKVIKLFEPSKPVMKKLLKQGIETRQWYCPSIHHHPLFKKMGAIALNQGHLHLNVIDDLSEKLIGLPFHSFLNEEDILEVIETLSANINKNKQDELNDGTQ
jgi:dTDP-4-amino-4,6-dideoxygalactose transaminase